MTTTTIPAPRALIGETAEVLNVTRGAPRIIALALALDELAAFGVPRDEAHRRLGKGEIVTTPASTSYAVTVHSLYEHETGRRVAATEVPGWFAWDVSTFRMRMAMWAIEAPARAALDERMRVERARGYHRDQAEFIAQGGEQREEAGRAE